MLSSSSKIRWLLHEILWPFPPSPSFSLPISFHPRDSVPYFQRLLSLQLPCVEAWISHQRHLNHIITEIPPPLSTPLAISSVPIKKPWSKAEILSY